MENGNQPAYPILDPNGSYYREGVTKREYFARSAPNKIPSWFKHHYEVNKPCIPSWEEISDKEARELVREWQDDMSWDLPEQLMWVQEKVEKSLLAVSEWELNNQKERYFQWRVYYAENLLAALNTQK